MSDTMFMFLSVMIVLASIGVVAFKQPLHSALSLILCMMGVAGIFALLGAHFLAIAQVIVYAGAVMVLVVFVLMLLNAKEEKTKGGHWVSFLAIAVGGLFVLALVPLIHDAFGTLKLSDVNPSLVGTVKEMGKVLYTRYLFPFEIASVLIMTAIVGAVMLSMREKVNSVEHK